MSLSITGESGPFQETSQMSEESQLKFALDGTARPFPGATVLCHLPDSGVERIIHRAIIDNCFETKDNELLRDHYVQLPASSLHMTILDTVVYKYVEAEVEQTSKVRNADMLRFRQAFLDTECQAVLRKNIPVTMEIDLSASRYDAVEDTLKVPVKPRDEKEASKLHTIRNTLGAAFNMSFVDPAYPFHITAYYPIRPLSAEQFSIMREHWSKAVKSISETVSTFEINRIELCAFENMCHFEVKEFV